MEFNDIVEKSIRVQAAPNAKIGDIRVCCVGAPITEECATESHECVCTVRQLVYIEFPVRFSVRAEAEQDVIDGSEPPLLPETPPVRGLLKSARSRRPRRRPLLFVLMERLQTLFPHRG